VALVQLDQRLVTAYMADGKTRMKGGVLPDDHHVINVRGPAWQASPATATALVALDAEIVKVGGSRPRLVDVYRSPSQQAEARTKFNRWVAAGKPRTVREGLDLATMKTVYVRPVGESLHNAGMAVDFDQDAFAFLAPGCSRGTNLALAMFWEIALQFGFTPIIGYPEVHQEEAWHFDRLGPLTPILELARKNGSGSGNLVASQVATTLQGYQWADHGVARMLQARLTVIGHWCGPVDGLVGPRTLAAAKAAGCTAAAIKRADPAELSEDIVDRFAGSFTAVLGAL
jgi:hypothetical protein